MSYGNVENVLKIEGVKAKGFGIIPKIAMQDTRLTIEAKAIYSYFCSYAGAGTTAFPSVKKIISDLKISKDRYYKHFDLLKKYGYIKTEQKNTQGKFNQNIYILVEKPVEVTEEKTSPQNKETVDTPNPYFKDTGNKDSDRPCPYFTHTQIPHTQNPNTENQDSKINSLFKINSSLKSSVSQSKEGQAKGLTQEEVEELNDIFEKAELGLFNNDEKIFVIQAIHELYFSNGEKINKTIVSKHEIRNELKKLTLNTIDFALRKFKSTKNTTKIKNPKNYFKVILFNSISEAHVENLRII
ncbi:MAG: helix-turn-helix domain-containing protein [Maledivibacter sp.]|nr:helix-turn-helix domain-containing protein [Maledivibacter sp.]